MSYLGDKQRSEVIRFWLALDAAPTGIPTISITRGQGTALGTPISAVNMTQGASTLEWYYDYTSEAAAEIGLYTAKYIAVIDGVTRYAYDNYDVTVNDADSIKAETASIQTDTTSIETKVDTVDTVVDSIQTDTTAIIVDTTSIESKVDAVPTVGEIDTELTGTHGPNSWQTGTAGTGAKAITFNIKDGSANNLEGVNVSVHNAANDESPVYASGQTDTNGDTAEWNLDGVPTTYKIRLSKAGAIISETKTQIISADATIDLTVVAQTVSNPTDPDVCRLRIYPITLGNADITDLADNLMISSLEDLMKVEGQFISNTNSTFTYDATTTPDSYYFDAVRGSLVFVKCDILGIDTEAGITVPDLATKDLADLIT